MSDVQQPLHSPPGVGARRKGQKTVPKLPLSVFTPPSTGTSDRFPLPPSPSAVHPSKITDAHVVNLDVWKAEAESALDGKADDIVLSLNSAEAVKDLPSDVSILAISIPLPQEGKSVIESLSTASPRIHFNTTISKSTPSNIEGILSALNQDSVVDIHCNVGQADGGWEIVEEVIDKTLGAQKETKGKIVLSNILPPPQSLDLPIVKLLTHQSYNAYQSYIASLSLNSNVFLKFLPPAWGEPTPEAARNDISKEAKEWKRRVKMYLGPAVEAFGFERIIFGSAPSPEVNFQSKTSYWYEIARESFAELGLEQEDIDAVFSGNAKTVYT